MGAIEPGPRDHLVTRWLEEVLADLDPELLDEIRLDPAEAPERLSRHAMEVLRARIDPEGSADEQTELVNRLVEDLASDPDPEEEIAIPRVLRGIEALSAQQVLPLAAACRRSRSARATCSSTARGSRASALSSRPSLRRPSPST